MEKIDRLNRRPDQKVDVEKDNENQIFIKDHQLRSLLEIVIEEPEVNILEKIKIAMSRDKKVIRVVEEIKKAGVKVLRVEIIQLHHNVLVAGYREK